MKTALTLILIIFIPHLAYAYTYERKLLDSNIIHVVRINSGEYKADLVKANKRGDLGREKVSSIAERSNATIAINAGFFEIGGKTDGNPSGTLIIAGKVYSMKNKSQPLILMKDGLLEVKKANPSQYKSQNVSIVSGIPMLIENGEIVTNNKKGQFYTKKHARTAVGVNSNGDVILVVAEHRYMKDVSNMTMAELQKMIKEKGDALAKKYQKKDAGDITLKELRQILLDDSAAGGSRGLTILELAKLMRDLGCENAINLDGGGSSTLWIKGNVVNSTVGDKDESAGKLIERPVSDALLFKIQ